MLKNPRHEKFAREYARKICEKGSENVSKTAVYREVFPAASYNTARSSAPALVAKPAVENRIRELVENWNPPEQIARDLSRLRRAKKEVIDAKGNIVKLVDNGTRLAAVQTVLKVTGAMHDGAIFDARSVSFGLTGETAARMQTVLERLDRLVGQVETESQPISALVEPNDPIQSLTEPKASSGIDG